MTTLLRHPAFLFVQLLVLPITVTLSLTLIADIDSPRGGLIRVVPLNLMSLAQSLPANP